MTTVCDFTAQDYEGLQRLQKDLADRGFAVLGFPCNQFGHQEPGDAVEIARWLKKEAKGLLGSGRSSGTSRSSWLIARAAW